MSWIPVAVFELIARLAVDGVVLAVRLERKRTEAMCLLAQQMRFSFSPKDTGAMLSRLGGFHLFSTGRSRRITNAMHGDAKGIEVGIFDYRYTTGGGRNSHTWSQTVICFWSEMLKLPDFSLRPEHVFDKIGSLLGFQNIDFHRYPTFSKKYLLKGSDEEPIRAAFNESVLAFYESIHGLSTEGAGTCLVYYRSGKRVKPQEIMGFMEDGFRVFELFASGRRKVP